MTAGQESTQAMNASLGRPVRMLLVEDSASDIAMTIEAIREGRIINELRVASDGETALDMLRRRGSHGDEPRPDLIILDLNLPRMDGKELLKELKSDESLMTIPVVVLTSSSSESDIEASYRLHANAYVTKPVGFDDFLAAVRSIENFWLTLVRLP